MVMDEKERLEEYELLAKNVSHLLKQSSLSNGHLISLLETLKIDIIINRGLVKIDGKSLEVEQ